MAGAAIEMVRRRRGGGDSGGDGDGWICILDWISSRRARGVGVFAPVTRVPPPRFPTLSERWCDRPWSRGGGGGGGPAAHRLRMVDDIADAASCGTPFVPPAALALLPLPALPLASPEQPPIAPGRTSRRKPPSAFGTRGDYASEPWPRVTIAYPSLCWRHGVILRELGDDEGLAAHLAETASLARKQDTPQGLRSVHQLRVLAAGVGAGATAATLDIGG